MEKILHGYHFGQIGKQGYAVIGALVGSSIAKRTHFFGIADKTVETLNARTCRSAGWRL